MTPLQQLRILDSRGNPIYATESTEAICARCAGFPAGSVERKVCQRRHRVPALEALRREGELEILAALHREKRSWLSRLREWISAASREEG